MSRFLCPAVTFVAPSDLPPDVLATKGAKDNELGVRVFVRTPQLHRLRDDDRGIVLQHWEVEAIVSDDHDVTNTVLMSSRSQFIDGDTHDSVANEYGADITLSLENFILSCIAQEASNDN